MGRARPTRAGAPLDSQPYLLDGPRNQLGGVTGVPHRRPVHGDDLGPLERCAASSPPAGRGEVMSPEYALGHYPRDNGNVRMLGGPTGED